MVDHATVAERRYWALVARPAVYRIEEAVRDLVLDTWTTKERPLAAGDGVVVRDRAQFLSQPGGGDGDGRVCHHQEHSREQTGRRLPTARAYLMTTGLAQ